MVSTFKVETCLSDWFEGRRLWDPGLQAGEVTGMGGSLLTQPVHRDEDSPSPGTMGMTGGGGQWRAHPRDWEVGAYSHLRWDGSLFSPWTVEERTWLRSRWSEKKRGCADILGRKAREVVGATSFCLCVSVVKVTVWLASCSSRTPGWLG